MRQRYVRAGTQKDEALTRLRGAVVRSLQNTIRGEHLVSAVRQEIDDFREKLTVLADSQTRDVFHEEMTGLQLENQTHIFFQQRVARIIKSAASNQRNPLAGRAARDQCNFPLTDAGFASNLRAGDARNVSSKRLPVREIVFVHCCVNRIVLDSGRDLVSGLLKAEGQSSSTCKEVNGERSCVVEWHASMLQRCTFISGSPRERVVHVRWRGSARYRPGVTSLYPQATAGGVYPQACVRVARHPQGCPCG